METERKSRVALGSREEGRDLFDGEGLWLGKRDGGIFSEADIAQMKERLSQLRFTRVEKQQLLELYQRQLDIGLNSDESVTEKAAHLEHRNEEMENLLLDLDWDSNSLAHIQSRTQCLLAQSKTAVSLLTSQLHRFSDKVSLLTDDEQFVISHSLSLCTEFDSVQSQAERLKRDQTDALGERILTLRISNEVLAKKWTKLSQEESAKQQRALKIDQLRGWLQRQKEQKIRLLMSIGLEEMLKKKLSGVWARLTKVFGTAALAEILRKNDTLQFRNESLMMDADSLIHQNAALRSTVMQLREAAVRNGDSERRGSYALEGGVGEAAGQRGTDGGEAWTRRVEHLAKTSAMFLCKMLTYFLQSDPNHVLLPPSLPPFRDLPLPHLFLVFTKALITAYEIGRQRPSMRYARRKTVMSALHLMLQNAMTKQTNKIVTQRSSEQYNSHFVRPVVEDERMLKRDSYIGSLLASVANYENIAIEAVKNTPANKSVPAAKSARERIERDYEVEDLQELRALRKTYKLEKFLSPQTLSSVSPVLKPSTSLRDFRLSTTEQRSRRARELIALDKQRHGITMQNLKYKKEESVSFLLIASKIQKSKEKLLRRRTMKTSPQSTTSAELSPVPFTPHPFLVLKPSSSTHVSSPPPSLPLSPRHSNPRILKLPAL